MENEKEDYKESMARALEFIGKPALTQNLNEVIDRIEQMEGIFEGELEKEGEKDRVMNMVKANIAGRETDPAFLWEDFPNTHDAYKSTVSELRNIFGFHEAEERYIVPIDLHPDYWAKVVKSDLKEYIPTLLLDALKEREVSEKEKEFKKKIEESLKKHANRYRLEKEQAIRVGKEVLTEKRA